MQLPIKAQSMFCSKLRAICQWHEKAVCLDLAPYPPFPRPLCLVLPAPTHPEITFDYCLHNKVLALFVNRTNYCGFACIDLLPLTID